MARISPPTPGSFSQAAQGGCPSERQQQYRGESAWMRARNVPARPSRLSCNNHNYVKSSTPTRRGPPGPCEAPRGMHAAPWKCQGGAEDAPCVCFEEKGWYRRTRARAAAHAVGCWVSDAHSTQKLSYRRRSSDHTNLPMSRSSWPLKSSSVQASQNHHDVDNLESGACHQRRPSYHWRVQRLLRL